MTMGTKIIVISLHMFYNILDLTTTNAWILYKQTTGVNIPWRNFIFQLAEELHCDHQNKQK